MARRLLQAAGSTRLRVHPVSSSRHSGQPQVAPQKVVWGNGLPAMPGGPPQCEPWDIFLSQSPSGQQELLWRQFFLDPTLWCDNRQDKKTSRSPDFRHKESNEPLWLNNPYKPVWVDAQLNMLDTMRITRRPVPPASNSILPYSSGPLRVPDCQGQVTPHTVSQLCEKGQLSEAVDALGVLVEAESSVSTSLLHSVLQRCGADKKLDLGRRVHDFSVRIGYEANPFLANHILRMYASQGMLNEATDVFIRVPIPSANMWFSIISAHAKQGEPEKAIQLYHEMRNSTLKPNSYVFMAALHACAIAADLESGRQVHADLLESGVVPNLFVCNCLVDMYAKCGKLYDARKVFDSLGARDVVTWNAMIGGYADHELGQEALALYAHMEKEGLIQADSVTYACLLKACASAGALQQGKQLHSQIVQRRLLKGEIVVGNSLVEMYAKCGKLEDARTAFDSLPTKNVVTWNTMINGYGQCNEGRKAISCFEEMLQKGIQPDRTTFLCLLVACSHEGLVDEGRHYFSAMMKYHGIVPAVEHYTCMVDLLGRAGHLDEAEKMMLSCATDDAGLRSLLYACRSHGDMERGMRCFEGLVRIAPQNASAYVLMAKTYSDAGRWTDVDRIERLRKAAGARKKPAMAGIEVNKQVHRFVVGEERGDVSCKARSMNVRLKEQGGHVPHTALVLKPLSESEKEDDLCGHAEKLALAYGLLNTPDGTPLLVTKNLRMCMDCHSSTEIMSRIEKRDIVVRDAHRVHRFVDGSCSCGGRA